MPPKSVETPTGWMILQASSDTKFGVRIIVNMCICTMVWTNQGFFAMVVTNTEYQHLLERVFQLLRGELAEIDAALYMSTDQCSL